MTSYLHRATQHLHVKSNKSQSVRYFLLFRCSIRSCQFSYYILTYKLQSMRNATQHDNHIPFQTNSETESTTESNLQSQNCLGLVDRIKMIVIGKSCSKLNKHFITYLTDSPRFCEHITKFS